jgi:spermidine/putrescine transport system substrate-binding protein
MHPRERKTTRRRFVAQSGGALFGLLGGESLLRVAGALAGGPPMGPLGIPLARRNYPLTLPIYSDNTAIAAGKSPEKGPLEVFNWSAYINPAVVKDFQKAYGVKVNITTFENEEEALSKLASGAVHFDVWFATVEYLSRAVAGKLVQPLNHLYLPNLKNVWTALESPFYDRGSRYTVPYTVYTTGITWRKDKLSKGPSSYANPYDIFWNVDGKLKGKVAIIDDQREALGLALLRRHVTDVNTEDPTLVQRAESDLAELTKRLNVKTNQTDYQDVPAGATWLAQAWSGDMAAAADYMPKGVAVSVVGYWRPSKNAVVGSDMITVLRGAKSPVLAHHFLDYVLGNKEALKNLSWLGYMPPLKSINPDRLVAQGYIPKNLASTVVRESDFDHGVSLLPLTTKGQATWQDAWSKFKAG